MNHGTGSSPAPDEQKWLDATTRLTRLLLRLYPQDFRDEMGADLIETYRDRARYALRRRGVASLALLWARATSDSLHNGLAERMRPAISWRQGGNWGRDIERTARRIVRAPAFSLALVGTLSVGLGAFAVVYATVDKVLLAPLPYDRPDDLYYVWRDYTWIDLHRGWLGGTDVAELQKAGGPIAAAAAIRRNSYTLSTAASGQASADPEQIPVMITSPNLFSLLGARPALGRVFTPDESGPGRTALVVLSHSLWQRRFNSDRGVLDREIMLSGTPYRVIGVMRDDFRFVRQASLGEPQPADAYIALDERLAETAPNAGTYAGLIRGTPGSTPEAVAAAVNAAGAVVDRRDFKSRGLRLATVGLKADLVASVRPALIVLGAAGLLLVVVLAVNLATLLLVRASSREREFAITRAMGANPVAVVRATLLEAGVLGAIGGALGALIAVPATRLLVSLAPLTLPRRDTIAVDWKIALVVTVVGLALGLLAGAVPAMWAMRSDLSTLLRRAAVRGGGGSRMRRALVVVQVALSLVLLSAGGLVVRSFDRLTHADPGFDASGLLTFTVPAPRSRYPDSTAATALHERVERELATIPGVERVGASAALPLTAGANQTGLLLPGAPGNTGSEDHDRPLIDYITARAGYFETMRMRVIAGRVFEPARTRGVREAIIDRTLADAFYQGRTPLGAPIVLDGDTLRVIGVVEHARMYDVHQDGRSQVYIRNDDFTFNTLSFAVRTNGDPLALVSAVRETIRRIDPQLALAELRPMSEIVDDTLRQPRISAVLLAGFSLGALLLAAMGLFGVVAGAVSRRQHELAVRLALGADAGGVLRLVIGEGAVLVGLGLLVGLPGIYFAGKLVAGTLVGVSPTDPMTLVAVAGGLAIVTLAACYLPARRAAAIEPAMLLREG